MDRHHGRLAIEADEAGDAAAAIAHYKAAAAVLLDQAEAARGPVAARTAGQFGAIILLCFRPL